MKLTIILTAIAVVSASAQTAPMKPAATTASTAKPAANMGTAETAPVSLQVLRGLERGMDTRIATTGGKIPCNVLSSSRGIYVSGLGAVFSAEVELAPTPGSVGVFANISPQQKARYRQDKLANVPLLEQTLRDMALSLAASPALRLADNEQVVVAARLVYRSWEDLTGMPGQIVAHLDRRGGTVKMEVQ